MWVRVNENAGDVEGSESNGGLRSYRPVESPSRVVLGPLLVAAASEVDVTLAGVAV